jgi:hypothetical protein
MEARTLLYKLMVISPVGFIAWVGVLGRFSEDTFEFTANTDKQEAVIDQYQFPVAITKAYPNVLRRKLCDEYLIFVTDTWRNEMAIGRLQPVYPSEHGVFMRDGVASQIKEGAIRAIDAFEELGDRREEAGKPDQAAAFYLDAYRLATRLKFSDPVGVIIFSQEQTNVLHRLSRMESKLSPETHKTVTAFLKGQTKDRGEMTFMTRHLETLYAVYRRNREKPYSTGEPATVLAKARTKADEVFAPNRGPETDLQVARIRNRATQKQLRTVTRQFDPSFSESKAPESSGPSVQLAGLATPSPAPPIRLSGLPLAAK